MFTSYRPQGKVMFLEASVSHSVHRGHGDTLDNQTGNLSFSEFSDVLLNLTSHGLNLTCQE